MRRIQKKKFLEQIDMLREACGVLRQQPPGSVRVNLCADMQEFVSAIFNFLEQIAGEETRTAGLLCEFYKALFGASQGEAAELPALVDKIQACAQEELTPDKIEAAFFCYKASMSDCLETIYLAARADPACDAYFIPIPYYDKNPDGSLGQMHYEGDGCYWDKYELVDWQRYDVEERRPDMIFIMNPYDEYNYVTSVHPDFYARRLWKLTDLMLYVPYIIHSEVVDSVVGSLPGVTFAHQVIVQSENVRRQYIRSILDQIEGFTPEIANEKIVALGSPKTDKLIRCNKEDYDLPPQWEEIIKTRDSGTRILLYNLSIETALSYSRGENSGGYLKKIRSVLSFFENRRDVILWWRPHPLLEETFRSMRPQLYREYQAMVADYRAAGYGIYDDSPCMNRAVAYADACYGDESSVNLLLQFAGKPVLVQNVNNGGMEPTEAEDEKHVKEAMEAFVAKDHYNSYIMYESKGGFSLSGFIAHFHIIMERSKEQSAKYRRRYVNADGRAGEKIYQYTRAIVRSMYDE